MAITAQPGSGVAAPRLSILLAPFAAVGRFLVQLAESGPRMQALERLSRMTDADLAERGLTREGEIRRILGISAAI